MFDATAASPDAAEPRSAVPTAVVPCAAGRYRSSTIRSADPHGLLRVGAEAQFRRGEQAVDNVGRAFDAVIDELGLAGRPDDKERRGLALGYAGRELDIDLVPVIEGLDRPPRGRISADTVTEAQRRHVDAARRRDVDACLGLGILSPQRDELVLRIAPGDRGHIGLPGR